MSTYKEVINEFIASTDPNIQNESVEKLVSLLQNNEITLLDFVQALQFYITSTTDSMRVLTFSLISQVLSKLPNNKLFPSDIDVLLAFLYSKILDRPVIKYVLLSIFSLVSMKYYNNSKTDELLTILTSNYNPKENVQSIRLLSLKIINFITNTMPKESYSDELIIKCFLHCSQNEKDPNNLLLIFQILQKISKTLDIEPHLIDLFDTMFRYYPISFKSSDDSKQSQINSLKDSLNSSLASNDLYAAELFPNLIDKFNSATLTQVKLDILTTISIVSQIYSKNIIDENFMILWNTIKYSIINLELAQLISIDKIMKYYESSTNDSDQVFHSALIAIKNLSSKISNDSKLLIFDDLNKSLILTERNRHFLQSYLTLAIVSSASYDENDGEYDTKNGNFILKKTLEKLFSDEQPIDQIRNKRLMLMALSYFTSDSKFTYELITFKDQIINLLQSSLSSSNLEVTLHTLAIQLTVEIILAPTIISKNNGTEISLLNNETPILIGKLSEMLIENALSDPIHLNTVIENELLISLSKLAKTPKCENSVINQVINNILMKINDSNLSLVKKCKLFDYLVKLAKTPSLIQIISVRIMSLLSNDRFDLTDSNIPSDLVLQTLTSLFGLLPLYFNTLSIINKFLPNLIQFLIKQNDEVSESHVNYICQIVRKLIVGLNNENADALISQLFNLFSKVLSIDLIDMQQYSLSSSFLLQLNIDNAHISYKNIPILLFAIQGLDTNVDIKNKVDLLKLLTSLVNILSIEGISELCKIEILANVSIIFNKYLDWKDYNSFFNLDKISEKLNNTYELKIWCLYGLIMKCDSNATEEFIKMLNLLSFKNASKAISIIFTPIVEVLDDNINSDDGNENENDEQHKNMGLITNFELICTYKKEREVLLMVRNKNKLMISNLIIRNMWKQRILEILLSKKDETENSNKFNKENIQMDYILPLILTYLPEELYSSHLKSLLPNLLNTLETCNDYKVILSIIKIICNVIMEESGRELIKPYINTIIELNLKVISDISNHNNLRKQSLKCLLGMCLFELPCVIPFKKQVVKISEVAIADKNRGIRMAGVSVRQAWEDLGVDLSM